MTLWHEATRSAAAEPPGAGLWLVTISLVAYAMLAPLAVVALVHPLAPRWVGALALAASLLGPGLATIVATWRGLGTIARDFASRPDAEPQQCVLRIFVSAAAFAYLGGLSAAGFDVASMPALLDIAVLGTLTAWLMFLHCVVAPSSRVRRGFVLMCDALLLGAFLHWGDQATAPWSVLFLVTTFDWGLRFGPRMLIASALVNVLFFGAVVATTGFWRDNPLADLPFLLTLLILPVYGGVMTGSIAATRRHAVAALDWNAQRDAAMSHELRLPLNTLLGVTTLLARSKLEPAVSELVATSEISAQTLLGLLNEHLAQAPRSDPETVRFDPREVLNGVVSVLRPQAEALAIELALAVDPRLPAACRGARQGLRRALLDLVADIIRSVGPGRLAIAAALAQRAPDSFWLRIALRNEANGIAAPADRGIGLFSQADPGSALTPAETESGTTIAVALIEGMGGTITRATDEVNIAIPFAYEDDASIGPPDLAGQHLVLVTHDRDFAERLKGWIRAWHGEPHWQDASDDDPTAPSDATCHLVVIDGRRDPLAGLSLAHRLATGALRGAGLLFIAPAAASEAVASLGAAHLDAVIEDPVTEATLASALHGVLNTTIEPGHSLMVLIADTNEPGRESLKTALEHIGHRVMFVPDGGAAIAALDGDQFDVAFLELDMPGVSGDAVAKLHRLRHPGGGVALVALAPDALPLTEARCRQAGFDTIVTPPYSAPVVSAAVTDARAARERINQAGVAPSPDPTPISSHPRFSGDAAEIVREATIESLRGLGGNDFLADVVETFRSDAGRLVAALRQASEQGDLAKFEELAHALRSGAAHIGGVRLCQTLTALEDVSAHDLRLAGVAYTEKIASELARLERALEPYARAQRHG
ncbi:MAG TPA: response regulator [Stellaceae bacterium]|nr:response regulator [Stellaceae bacterium]